MNPVGDARLATGEMVYETRSIMTSDEYDGVYCGKWWATRDQQPLKVRYQELMREEVRVWSMSLGMGMLL
jgi:hypothetical protein